MERMSSGSRRAVVIIVDMLDAANSLSVNDLDGFMYTDAQNVNGRDFMIRGNAVGLYTIPTIEAQAFSPGEKWTNDDMFNVFPQTIGRSLKNEFGPKEES